MDRYVVLGNPVAHSQSPFIHTAFAEQTGQALEYGRVLCAPDGFEAALDAFAAEGGRGCNVTMPFKFDAFRLAHARTPRGELAGACNTLRRENAHWFGDNTDGAGLLRDIERNAGVALRGRRILLLGAGGAAAGVLGPLLGAAPAQLVVANRTPEKAAELLRTHRAAVEARRAATVDLRAAALDDCGDCYDVVVNATSSSMLRVGVPVAPRVLAPGGLALDMMYGSAARGFLEWAARHGAVGRDGLGMLVEQAAEAFALFRGVQPETAPVLAALRRRMAEAGA
ncbi:MAG: shikimate dehydrogenase [Caldimonas sp.]